MDAEWIRWAAGIALTCIGGLVWYEIRRVGNGVHKLRTDVSTMILRLEGDVRQNQRDIAHIQGAQEESARWREMVLELVRGRA